MIQLDNKLVEAATELLKIRFPDSGGLAAAAYTSDGEMFTSVVFDPDWGGGGLCAETGALLDIHKADKTLAAIACVTRLNADSPIMIAAPCGICQERIYHWGYNVQIAIPEPDNPEQWMMATLRDLQPHHWVKVFIPDVADKA